MNYNRRRILKLSAAGLATPWLGAMNQLQAADGDTPKRVLIYIDPYGRSGARTSSTESDTPWITDESSDYDLTSDHLGWMLKPLEDHLEDLSVISGVTMKSRSKLGGGVSHAQVNTYTLTGSRVSGNFRSNPVCAHSSINHFLGKELNAKASIKSIYDDLPIGSASAYNYDDTGARVINSLKTPTNLYNSLFGLTDTSSLHAKQSVIEQVKKQIGIITPELVQANATTVMDAYYSSLDSIAKELELRGSLQCDDKTAADLASASTGAEYRAQMTDAMYDIFSCGLTSSIAIGYNQSHHHTPLLDDTVSTNANVLGQLASNYHTLSHRNNDVAGVAQGLIMRSQISDLASLAERLKTTPELDGSGTMMMDNTVIFYHQSMSSPTHVTTKPYYHFMLAGSNTNVVRGKHFECSDNSDNELWTTLAQAVGLPVTQFGGYKYANYAGEELNTGPISKILTETLGV